MLHYSGLCEVLAVRIQIFTFPEFDTRREFTANIDAVRFSSLTPNRLSAAAPPLLDADDRAPSPPPDVIQRVLSFTPSLTPVYSPTASRTADNDAPLVSPRAVTPQLPPTLNAHPDADTRPQRRRNLPPYYDDYILLPFQQFYNVECAKFIEEQYQVTDVVQSVRSCPPSILTDGYHLS